MLPTVVRESRIQAVARLGLCAAFVGVCLWGLGRPRASHVHSLAGVEAVGWMYVGIAFFGVLALRYLWTLCRPGTLTIDGEGITQNLGWRRLHWDWKDIDRTEVIRTAGGLVSACLLYPRAGGRVWLFGWELSADELQAKIAEYRSARRPPFTSVSHG